jgi:hypothetical protein
MVSLSDGTFIAAWTEQDYINNCGVGQYTWYGNLMGARGSASGWSAPFALTVRTDYQLSQFFPTLQAITAAGTDVMAAWEIFTDAGYPYASEFFLTALQPADATWEAPQAYIYGAEQEGIHNGAYQVVGTALSLNSGGNGFVTWQLPVPPDGGYDAPYDEFVAPITNLTLGSAQDLSAACPIDPAPYSATFGTVAINADGGGAAVWVANQNEFGEALLESFYSPTTGWGPCASVGVDAGMFGADVTVPVVADIGGGAFGTIYEDSSGGGVYFESSAP